MQRPETIAIGLCALVLASACGPAAKEPDKFSVRSVAGVWNVYRTYGGGPELGPDATEWSNSGTGYGIRFTANCSSYVLPNGWMALAGEIHGDRLTLASTGVSWSGSLAADDVSMVGTLTDAHGAGTWRAVKTSGATCGTYEVWGGGSASACPTDGYTPEAHGYTYLGSGTATATFAGSGSYFQFVVLTRDRHVAWIDTVSSNGTYFSAACTGNTAPATPNGGPPDGQRSKVGTGAMSGGGFLAIEPGLAVSSITVHL